MKIISIMKIQLTHKFEDIISVENLLDAWREFIKGKRKRQDVQEFQLHLMDNIFSFFEPARAGGRRKMRVWW